MVADAGTPPSAWQPQTIRVALDWFRCFSSVFCLSLVCFLLATRTQSLQDTRLPIRPDPPPAAVPRLRVTATRAWVAFTGPKSGCWPTRPLPCTFCLWISVRISVRVLRNSSHQKAGLLWICWQFEGALKLHMGILVLHQIAAVSSKIDCSFVQQQGHGSSQQ